MQVANRPSENAVSQEFDKKRKRAVRTSCVTAYFY